MDLALPAVDVVLVQERLRRHIAAEVLELEPRATSLSTPEVAGVLEEPLGVVLQHHEDPGQIRGQLVERHRSVDVPLLSL